MLYCTGKHELCRRYRLLGVHTTSGHMGAPFFDSRNGIKAKLFFAR